MLSPEATHAASQLGRTVERALIDSDLSAAGYRLLAYLSTGDAAAKVLATKLAVSRPVVTATVDWLEPRGYVTRTPDPIDKRRVTISITARGQEALAFADSLVASRLATVLDGVADEEFSRIQTSLELLHDALNEYRARSRPDRSITDSESLG